MMHIEYLKRVEFSDALERQEILFAKVNQRESPGVVLAFESQPVVTLGVRSDVQKDLECSVHELAARGYQLQRLDRGGQTTMHHPGQLVIFPIFRLTNGVRQWITQLSEVTRKCLREWGVQTVWNPAHPGLFTERGKIMACGLRVRRGISTHGLAINVCNELGDFSLIHACGVRGAALDQVGRGVQPEVLFKSWLAHFQQSMNPRSQS